MHGVTLRIALAVILRARFPHVELRARPPPSVVRAANRAGLTALTVGAFFYRRRPAAADLTAH